MVTDCFYKFIGGATHSRPGLYEFYSYVVPMRVLSFFFMKSRLLYYYYYLRYIMFAMGMLDMLEKNVYLLDTATTHETINDLTKLSEKYLPIWKPLREVVKESDLTDIDNALPNATINVNAILNDISISMCRTKTDCQNSTILYNFLTSKKAEKVFRYNPKTSKYLSVTDISNRLAHSLDLNVIARQQSSWRAEVSWDLIWLKNILYHVSSILGESGNLLDVASKIDFDDLDILGVPGDLADGVVNILKNKTVDKLFAGYISQLILLYKLVILYGKM